MKIFDDQLAISRRKWWCPNEIFSYPSQTTTKPHNNISTHSLLKILWKYFSFVRSNCCTFLYELWIRNDFAPVQNDDDRASVVARRSPLPPLLLTTFTKVHQKLRWNCARSYCHKSICTLLMIHTMMHVIITFLRNKRFSLNLVLRRNASKFAIFYVHIWKPV